MHQRGRATRLAHRRTESATRATAQIGLAGRGSAIAANTVFVGFGALRSSQIRDLAITPQSTLKGCTPGGAHSVIFDAFPVAMGMVQYLDRERSEPLRFPDLQTGGNRRRSDSRHDRRKQLQRQGLSTTDWPGYLLTELEHAISFLTLDYLVLF